MLSEKTESNDKRSIVPPMALSMRIFVSLIILTAVVIGIIVLYAPREMLVKLIVFRDFFDSALPILAFGALIKYLCMDWKK